MLEMKCNEVKMYTKGEIVKLISVKPFLHLSRNITKKGYNYLIIIKTDEENYSIVARCLKNKKAGDWYCSIKINGTKYYVATKKFIKVPNSILVKQPVSIDASDINETINHIYSTHNDYHRKRLEKHPDKLQKIELSKKYFHVYQNAVINNDLKRLDELKKILGVDPTVFFAGTRNKKDRNAPLESDNISRPFYGGSFTPK